MSASQVEAVARMLKEGCKIGQIVKALRLTKGQVSGIIFRNKLRDETPAVVTAQEPWTADDIVKVRAMVANKASIRAIAAEFGIGRETARGRMRRHGIVYPALAVRNEGRRIVRASRVTPVARVVPSGQARLPMKAATLAIAPVSPPAPVMPRLALGKHECQWPLGHPDEPGFRFCCDAAVLGKPYCGVHCGLAYVKPASVREGFVSAIAITRMQDRGTLTAKGGAWLGMEHDNQNMAEVS